MKRTVLAALVGLLALAPFAAHAQWGTIYTDSVRPSTASGGASPTTPVQMGPSATSGCSISTTGELSCTQAHTDGYVFLPAWDVVICKDANNANTFTPTRLASNDWALGHPNGVSAGTTAINCMASLNSWLQRAAGVAGKGVKINSIDLVYQITGQALTAHLLACQASGGGTPASCLGGLATEVVANNTANVIGSNLATLPTLATATQTNPYLTNIVVTTPAFLPTSTRTAVSLEWQATPAANTNYKIYGLGINFSVLAE